MITSTQSHTVHSADIIVDYLTPPEDAHNELLLHAHLNERFGADVIANELHKVLTENPSNKTKCYYEYG